jgi:hypothetical protein
MRYDPANGNVKDAFLGWLRRFPYIKVDGNRITFSQPPGLRVLGALDYLRSQRGGSFIIKAALVVMMLGMPMASFAQDCEVEPITVYPELHNFDNRTTWLVAYNPQVYPMELKFRIPGAPYSTWFTTTIEGGQRFAFEVTSIAPQGGFVLEVYETRLAVTATTWDTTNGIYSQPFSSPSFRAFRKPCL